MTPLTVRLSELATAAPRQAVKRVTPTPATAHQAMMDRLSLSCETPHVDNPREDLDHLSLTSDEHQAESEDRWM